MPNKTITIYGDSQKEYAKGLIDQMPKGSRIKFMPEPKRTDIQNDKIHPMIRDIAQQKDWHGQRLNETQWKELLTGSFSGQASYPSLDGNGVIFIGKGKSTSQMGVREMAEFIEYIYSVGASLGVEWTEPLHDNV